MEQEVWKEREARRKDVSSGMRAIAGEGAKQKVSDGEEQQGARGLLGEAGLLGKVACVGGQAWVHEGCL
jgi:hypothetical protein